MLKVANAPATGSLATRRSETGKRVVGGGKDNQTPNTAPNKSTATTQAGKTLINFMRVIHQTLNDHDPRHRLPLALTA
jgi:hypothetical protein